MIYVSLETVLSGQNRKELLAFVRPLIRFEPE
jgi:hypothetical protein